MTSPRHWDPPLSVHAEERGESIHVRVEREFATVPHSAQPHVPGAFNEIISLEPGDYENEVAFVRALLGLARWLNTGNELPHTYVRWEKTHTPADPDGPQWDFAKGGDRLELACPLLHARLSAAVYHDLMAVMGTLSYRAGRVVLDTPCTPVPLEMAAEFDPAQGARLLFLPRGPQPDGIERYPGVANLSGPASPIPNGGLPGARYAGPLGLRTDTVSTLSALWRKHLDRATECQVRILVAELLGQMKARPTPAAIAALNTDLTAAFARSPVARRLRRAWRLGYNMDGEDGVGAALAAHYAGLDRRAVAMCAHNSFRISWGAYLSARQNAEPVAHAMASNGGLACLQYPDDYLGQTFLDVAHGHAHLRSNATHAMRAAADGFRDALAPAVAAALREISPRYLIVALARQVEPIIGHIGADPDIHEAGRKIGARLAQFFERALAADGKLPPHALTRSSLLRHLLDDEPQFAVWTATAFHQVARARLSMGQALQMLRTNGFTDAARARTSEQFTDYVLREVRRQAQAGSLVRPSQDLSARLSAALLDGTARGPKDAWRVKGVTLAGIARLTYICQQGRRKFLLGTSLVRGAPPGGQPPGPSRMATSMAIGLPPPLNLTEWLGRIRVTPTLDRNTSDAARQAAVHALAVPIARLQAHTTQVLCAHPGIALRHYGLPAAAALELIGDTRSPRKLLPVIVELLAPDTSPIDSVTPIEAVLTELVGRLPDPFTVPAGRRSLLDVAIDSRSPATLRLLLNALGKCSERASFDWERKNVLNDYFARSFERALATRDPEIIGLVATQCRLDPQIVGRHGDLHPEFRTPEGDAAIAAALMRYQIAEALEHAKASPGATTAGSQPPPAPRRRMGVL